ncbi:calcium/sodium antiporter [Halogeometricum borinquense]|uniref:K+dependent Na+ exchanger related-protein n=2 Tax=Halogeometricum borinquense TaxID=60847 RepID=E4NS12_HALBP|nr:calcium/sodium antiporter [Halogeometricum borinquense]ADQ68058.1 K+dependent Na+ exchanger related-protein [Halogeometricum borinquense DSM 11551]ELY24383.1 k+dependent na+ exchanger related-protein [Halogeometricum borinquense DSM 11551]QIB73341.1 calcium/sodium antiporter [Halogeometricum borinquense]QIQ77260.1 calcium/sodium antiporter [Halogeometricum borinquense]RYJ13027.1 calcium/sodium antiporter [Halogeometricum borinquense]
MASTVLLSTDMALLLVGVVALYAGAEFLVRAASRLAIGFGIRAAVVGVTVVAFATTAPELAVVLLSGFSYSTNLGLGAIVGSNIANIGLVLGLSALVRPLNVDESVLIRHVPFMFAAAGLLVLLGMDGRIGTFDGVVLLAVLAVFTSYLLYRVRASRPDAIPVEDVDVDDDSSVGVRDAVILLAGLGLLLLGSRWLIQGGQGVLKAYGFGERFIGLTVLAFGTSLPELAASIVSAAKGEAQFSIGNVVGSNIYNILAVIGVLAVLVPVGVPAETLALDFPALVVFTVVVVALMAYGRTVSRADGAVLVVGYLGFFSLLL